LVGSGEQLHNWWRNEVITDGAERAVALAVLAPWEQLRVALQAKKPRFVVHHHHEIPGLHVAEGALVDPLRRHLQNKGCTLLTATLLRDPLDYAKSVSRYVTRDAPKWGGKVPKAVLALQNPLCSYLLHNRWAHVVGPNTTPEAAAAAAHHSCNATEADAVLSRFDAVGDLTLPATRDNGFGFPPPPAGETGIVGFWRCVQTLMRWDGDDDGDHQHHHHPGSGGGGSGGSGAAPAALPHRNKGTVATEFSSAADVALVKRNTAVDEQLRQKYAGTCSQQVLSDGEQRRSRKAVLDSEISSSSSSSSSNYNDGNANNIIITTHDNGNNRDHHTATWPFLGDPRVWREICRRRFPRVVSLERRTFYHKRLGYDVVNDPMLYERMLDVLSKTVRRRQPWNTTFLIHGHVDNSCIVPDSILSHPQLHRVYCKNAKRQQSPPPEAASTASASAASAAPHAAALFPLPIGFKFFETDRPEAEDLTERVALWKQKLGLAGGSGAPEERSMALFRARDWGTLAAASEQQTTTAAAAATAAAASVDAARAAVVRVLLPPAAECGEGCWCSSEWACPQRNRSEVERVVRGNFLGGAAEREASSALAVELTILGKEEPKEGSEKDEDEDEDEDYDEQQKRRLPLPPAAYLGALASYDFVVSPPGVGEDTHRTWEALALGVVPVVLRTPLVDMGLLRRLPVMVVDSYDDLTPYAVRRHVRSLAAGLRRGDFDFSRVYAPYWEGVI
jgi:hypothetical protein